jgi:RHS repeat-associated protein
LRRHFGPVRTHTGASTQWSFTGEQNDPSGLEYLRARYYDPAIGRFLTRDPVPFIQRYAYVGNNPVRFTDPYGLWCPPGAGAVCDKVGDVVDKAGDVAGAAAKPVGQFVTETVPEAAGNAGEALGNAWPYVSKAVQIADIVPIWGTIPFVNVPATLISVPLDIGAFIAAEIDVLTSPCSIKKKVGLGLNAAANLGVGAGGQALSALASPSAVGPPIIAGLTSGVEGALYTANERAISRCEKE